jgi:hypothetical protein
MEWLPAESADVESDAVPPVSVAVPRELAPSKNCTLPVAAAGETVAVNVTDCPDVDGFDDDATDVVVLIDEAFTVCVRTEDVLAACVLSPL